MTRHPIPVQQEYNSYSMSQSLQIIQINKRSRFELLEMILNLKEVRGYAFEPPQVDPWDVKFIKHIISSNSQCIQIQKNYQLKKGQPSIDLDKILEYMNDPSEGETLEISLPEYPHSYYSSFVPLRRHNYRWINQLHKQYPYLGYLQEQDLTGIQQMIEDRILKEQHLLSKSVTYNPRLSMTERVHLRAQALKLGSFIGCKGDAGAWHFFLSGIDSCLNGVQNKTQLRSNMELTVGANERVTEDVISSTMKNLYCQVCLIYDCMIHEGQAGNTNYVSAGNKLAQEVHLRKAIRLVQTIPGLGGSQDTGSQEEPSQAGEGPGRQACSNCCYKLKQSGPVHFLNFSALTKSVIQVGIHLFSFEPCLIKRLFRTREIECMHIYQFLLHEYAVLDRAESKFFLSEELMLTNEQSQLPSNCSAAVYDPKKKKRKKKKSKRLEDKVGGKSICTHHFVSEPSQDIECRNCECTKRGFCLPECLCSDQCTLMKVGCKCKVMGSCRTNQCPCFKNKTECHPGLCRTCCGEEKITCKNLAVQRGLRKNVRIGVSRIPGAGLGLYAGDFIGKDELVTVYLGESVEPCVEELRHATTRDSFLYTFDTEGLTLDAKFIGNKARFINHGESRRQNLAVQILKSQGEEWICFFALRDIEEHEELYFDYDGTGELAKNHHKKYPFIIPK